MAYLVQIGQRKQRKNLRRVLLRSPIPSINVAELALDHSKPMLSLGPYTGQFSVSAFLLVTQALFALGLVQHTQE